MGLKHNQAQIYQQSSIQVFWISDDLAQAGEQIMRWLSRLTRYMGRLVRDDDFFLHNLDLFIAVLARLLSIGMMVVIIMSVYEIAHYMSFELQAAFTKPIPVAPDDRAQVKKFGRTLFTIFGLFLNALIAIEILENITAYLKKHVLQVELVIVTSLIAVARKIIILDLEKTVGIDLLALAATIFALSAAYWVVRHVNPSDHSTE
jgi:uncharacterized membrane protein (DUF373 family)